MRSLLKLHFFTLAMISSAAALIVASIAQYGYGLYPCDLCSYQRIPYGSILLFGGFAAVIGGWKRSDIGYLFGAIFMFSAALAFYHTGIEQHWWRAVNSCGGQQAMPSNLAELNLSLSNAIPKACDEVDWTLLGVPMSVYNTLFSLILSIMGLLSARMNRSGAI